MYRKRHNGQLSIEEFHVPFGGTLDPDYRSTVGHHGEVNRPLLAELAAAGWRPELWADVALEAEATAPQPLRGVFSGCGYEDPQQWRELGGMVLLARRLEQQLAQAAAGGETVGLWLAHSLLPFQLLGLARHLAVTPRAQVLISLMFAPGETLHGGAGDAQACANARVALAALERACRQQGHRLTLACGSHQHARLYAPLLEATGLESAGVHPPVVGAGCRPEPPPKEAAPLVLLHWGDLKPGKGRSEALHVLQALLREGVPEALRGWGWLFHQHSQEPLPPEEEAVLQEAGAQELGLVRLQGEVASSAMHHWLARCPVALLAYDPERYAERSSGMLWQWATSRQALGLPLVAVGYGSGWLAEEAAALELRWHACSGHTAIPQQDWLAATATAAANLNGQAPAGSPLQESFAGWVCRHANAA